MKRCRTGKTSYVNERHAWRGHIEMWWIFGVLLVAASAFVVVGTLARRPLGDVSPGELRGYGYVMLIVILAFMAVWFLFENPGVLR